MLENRVYTTPELPPEWSIRPVGADGLALYRGELLRFTARMLAGRECRAYICLARIAREMDLIQHLRGDELKACKVRDYEEASRLTQRRIAAYERMDRISAMALGRLGARKRRRS